MLQPFIQPKRDAAIDIARGAAIVIMVSANMGPVLHEPHSFFMRLSSSLPAPIFVALAGMMLAYHAENKTWFEILKRSGWILLLAAFTDMAAWGIRPFLGVDVLYLIGLGTIILHALRRMPSWALMALTAAFVVATPFLQKWLGYTIYPTEIYLRSGEISVPVEHQTPVWQHYIVDGWFPLFPWMAYMLGGFLLGRHRRAGGALNKKIWSLAALACLAGGGLLWWWQPGALYDRQGFSEMFYPPTIGFCITSAGFVIAMLLLAEATQSLRFWNPVRIMGQNSLFIYVLHSLVIGKVFVNLWQDTPLEKGPFLLVYAGFLCGLFACTLGLRALVRKFGLKANK